MRHPRLVIYESGRRLAALLQATANERRWLLREPRQPAACLRLLGEGGPAVLVLKVGRNLETELALLERVTWLCPEARTVLVGDADPGPLAALAWDLGADYVLFPPYPSERLIEVVVGLMGQESLPSGDPSGS
jgi:hypothetical protein